MAVLPKLPRRFISNVAWNSSATLVHALALQLLLLPALGRALDGEEFAVVLTAIALVNLFGLIIGTALSNLVMREYGKQHDTSSYQLDMSAINSCFLVVVVLAWICLVPIGAAVKVSSIGLVASAATLLALRVYLSAEFRIQLRYGRLTVCKVLIAATYIGGLGLFVAGFIKEPLLIILIGEIIGIAVLIPGSATIAAGVARRGWVSMARLSAGLGLSSSATNVLSYGDRLILSNSPVAHAVPVFFVSSLVGRLAQMAMNMIATVILSYLARTSVGRLSERSRALTAYALAVGGITWLVLQAVGPPAIAVLYPSYAEQATEILTIVNLAFALKVIEIVLRPMVLRTVRVRHIAVIDVAVAGAYLLLGVLLISQISLYIFASFFALIMAIRVLINVALVLRLSRKGQPVEHPGSLLGKQAKRRKA